MDTEAGRRDEISQAEQKGKRVDCCGNISISGLGGAVSSQRSEGSDYGGQDEGLQKMLALLFIKHFHRHGHFIS